MEKVCVHTHSYAKVAHTRMHAHTHLSRSTLCCSGERQLGVKRNAIRAILYMWPATSSGSLTPLRTQPVRRRCCMESTEDKEQ